MSTIIPAPDALIGKRFDVAVAKMMGISRAKATERHRNRAGTCDRA